jgi:hypothetical protein
VLDQPGCSSTSTRSLISDEIGIRKPRAEIFAAVLERLGAAPEEVIHVETISPPTWQAPHSSAFTPPGYPPRARPRSALAEYGGPAPST